MAYVSTTRIAADRGTRGLSGLIAALRNALAQRRVYSITLAELSQLNDRELTDLGISRYNIAAVAHQAAYGK